MGDQENALMAVEWLDAILAHQHAAAYVVVAVGTVGAAFWLAQFLNGE